MAAVTVFVDDAVLGRLPDVCVKDGVAATGRRTITQEVGRSNRVGLLWLLLLAGPPGWLAFALLAPGGKGERLVVQVPLSDDAYQRLVDARRLRRYAIGSGLLAGAGLLLLTAWLRLGGPGMVLSAIALSMPLAVAVVGWYRVDRESVDVTLDASRRWVALHRVHPAFVAAAQAQTADQLAH